MNILSPLVVFTALCLLAVCARAEMPACFENTGHRQIGGTNPVDFQCMQLLAAKGDPHWQYYLALVLIGQVPGEENIPEGLALLETVARSNNKYSGDAMRFLGAVYKSPNPALQDNELAYQWLYLASKHPLFRNSSAILPDRELSSVITPQRMKELEQSAPELLKKR